MLLVAGTSSNARDACTPISEWQAHPQEGCPALPTPEGTTMSDSDAPHALFTYHCSACGHDGNLRLEENSQEVVTACSNCGAEVLAEWDGGVTLTFSRPSNANP